MQVIKPLLRDIVEAAPSRVGKPRLRISIRGISSFVERDLDMVECWSLWQWDMIHHRRASLWSSTLPSKTDKSRITVIRCDTRGRFNETYWIVTPHPGGRSGQRFRLQPTGQERRANEDDSMCCPFWPAAPRLNTTTLTFHLLSRTFVNFTPAISNGHLI